jgi:hypothetical protein
MRHIPFSGAVSPRSLLASSAPRIRTRETPMRASIHRSLIAGLVIAGAPTASADMDGASDIAVWRWHVTNIWSAQRNLPDPPANHVIRHSGPFLADGSGAPSGDRLHR